MEVLSPSMLEHWRDMYTRSEKIAAGNHFRMCLLRRKNVKLKKNLMNRLSDDRDSCGFNQYQSSFKYLKDQRQRRRSSLRQTLETFCLMKLPKGGDKKIFHERKNSKYFQRMNSHTPDLDSYHSKKKKLSRHTIKVILNIDLNIYANGFPCTDVSSLLCCLGIQPRRADCLFNVY